MGEHKSVSYLKILRAHAALAEDPGLDSSRNMAAHNSLNCPVPRDLIASALFRYQVCTWCRHIHVGKDIKIILSKKW